MDYIKKNKKKVAIIAIVVIILILVFICLKLLMPDMTKSTWGNRLDGIEEHTIETASVDKIKTSITGTGKATAVTYNLTGRTMNFIITIPNSETRADAEALTSYITENISADDQSYYDIQVFYTSEDGNTNFMGYKHKTASTFSWGK